MEKLTTYTEVLLRATTPSISTIYKKSLVFIIILIMTCNQGFSQAAVASRWNEVFLHVDLVNNTPGTALYDPWEVTYGPDGFLWVTEGRAYQVRHIDPNTGAMTTVLDLRPTSTFLPAPDRTFNCLFDTTQSPWPQGGMMGLAIHPNFMTGKKYVYIAYVRSFDSISVIKHAGLSNGGEFFTNRLVRFTYDSVTGKLGSPVSLCDTLPGSSDHNSGRMIIAPVSGVNYLFYANGDMGAGQFNNAYRTNNAQNMNSYQGKILRFNLEQDMDSAAGSGKSYMDSWIPNDNPFNTGPVSNPTKQTAIWSSGIRNNQGFAFANIGGTDFLYGASHGPFSDDEINIIQPSKNYGHPLVIGFNDGNYDGAKAGGSASSLPLITSEATNATTIGANYQDPIYCFYAAPKGNSGQVGSIQYIYSQFNAGNQANGAWPSEAPSGMDIYTSSAIPGWKNSLLLGALKGGKIMRLNLNASGTAINTSNHYDTVNYFWSKNRFRDMAFSPDGLSIFTIIDRSSTTSGPTAGTPMPSLCGGCVQKYTFQGYLNNKVTNRSTIPNFIDIANTTTPNTCIPAQSIAITSVNDTLWIPITGPDGNILAEIRPGAGNMDGRTFTTSFYIHSGAMRENTGHLVYADRSFTITPSAQPTKPVGIRLYITAAEYANLKAAKNSLNQSTGITVPSDLRILKNTDACGGAMIAATTALPPPIVDTQSTKGYFLQDSLSSFSSFFISSNNMTVLPVKLISFKASLKNDAALIQWSTAEEKNVAMYEVERSIDGKTFEKIGTVMSQSSHTGSADYYYIDNDAAMQGSTVVFYKLNIVELNRNNSYSDVANVIFDNTFSVFVYPVPIKDELNARISLTHADNIEIQISDIHGRTVYQQTRMVPSGVTEIKINTQSWPSQSYFLKVQGVTDNNTITKKVIKL